MFRQYMKVLLLALSATSLQSCAHYNIVAAMPDLDEVKRVWRYCSACVKDSACERRDECQADTIENRTYALARAISQQDLPVVKYLIEEAGAGVDTVLDDASRRTSLHSAAYYFSEKKHEILRYLISRGANVNSIAAYDACTPLLTAIWKRNTEGARLLLANGADPNIKSTRGLDACAFALRWSHWEIMPDLPGCCARFLDKRWDSHPDEAKIRPPQFRAACGSPQGPALNQK